MRSSSPSLCHPGKNVPQSGPWWILSSHSLNKNKKNILRLSRIVYRRCTRLSVFVVLNSTTCLVKLNLIFHFFLQKLSLALAVSIMHNWKMRVRGKGVAAVLHNSKWQKTVRKCRLRRCSSENLERSWKACQCMEIEVGVSRHIFVCDGPAHQEISPCLID